MANLLPENKKKEIRKEFFARIIVVFFVFSFLSICVSIGLIFPSTILLDIKQTESRVSAKIFEETIDLNDNNVAINILKRENSKLKALQIKDEINFSQILEIILDEQPSTIAINTFYYNSTINDDKKNIKLTIRGVADRRSDLIDFVDVLEREDIFSQVDFPVSNLTKGRGIDFSLIILVKPI